MDNEVRIPDVEIVIRAGAFEAAVIAFFQREDIHQGYDILCGIGGQNEVPVVCALLQDAITALRSVDWVTLSELDASEDEKTEEPPFE